VIYGSSFSSIIKKAGINKKMLITGNANNSNRPETKEYAIKPMLIPTATLISNL